MTAAGMNGNGESFQDAQRVRKCKLTCSSY